MKRFNLKEELLKVISKVNEKNPYYLVVGALCFVLIFDYFLLMRFQLKAMRGIGPMIIELSDRLEQFELDKSRTGKYKKDIAGLDDRLGALEARIRTKEEIPLVLEEISRIGNKHKFFIEQILPEVDLGKPALKTDEGNYFLLPVMLQARSGYHSFGRFLNELENSGSLMNVERFSINTNSKNPRQHNIKLNIQAVIFEPVKAAKK